MRCLGNAYAPEHTRAVLLDQSPFAFIPHIHCWALIDPVTRVVGTFSSVKVQGRGGAGVDLVD